MSMGFSQKIALPVFRRAVDQVEMGVGGRADDDGVDVVCGKDGLGRPDLGADLGGQRLRRLRHRVGDGADARVVHALDRAGMHLPDATAAQ
jgi:hypothetical protein